MVLTQGKPGKSGAMSSTFPHHSHVGEVTAKNWEENPPAVLGGRRRHHALQQAELFSHPGAVPGGPVTCMRGLLKEEASLNLFTFLFTQPKPDKQVSPSSAQTAMGCGVR